jgi:hypothetical protein
VGLGGAELIIDAVQQVLEQALIMQPLSAGRARAANESLIGICRGFTLANELNGLAGG